jgi:hypothetical protein
VEETAFNTDGFDVSGDGVWIHDCSVWNQVGAKRSEGKGAEPRRMATSPLSLRALLS